MDYVVSSISAQARTLTLYFSLPRSVELIRYLTVEISWLVKETPYIPVQLSVGHSSFFEMHSSVAKS